jgi:hypothetical protein
MEANNGLRHSKNPPRFTNTWCSILRSQKHITGPFPKLGHMNPIHTLSHSFVKIHFKINPFKAHWFHYVPPALILKNSTFYPHSVSGDQIPVGARFSAPVQTGPGASPSLLDNGHRVFLGGKAAGA